MGQGRAALAFGVKKERAPHPHPGHLGPRLLAPSSDNGVLGNMWAATWGRVSGQLVLMAPDLQLGGSYGRVRTVAWEGQPVPRYSS